MLDFNLGKFDLLGKILYFSWAAAGERASPPTIAKAAATPRPRLMNFIFFICHSSLREPDASGLFPLVIIDYRSKIVQHVAETTLGMANCVRRL